LGALEESLQKKHQQINWLTPNNDTAESVLTEEEVKAYHLIVDTYDSPTPIQTDVDTSVEEETLPLPTSLIQQRTLAPDQNHVLYPLRIPLCPQTSKRCPLELSKGKPGILIKPKMNPLDGDSSQRRGNGQWFKKDCSAIHTIPKLSLLQHASVLTTPTTLGDGSNDGTSIRRVAFLLKLHNPTLGPIRVRLQLPKSALEHDAGEQVAPLKNVLLDGYTREICNEVHMWHAISSANAATGPVVSSEWIELESSQDALIDLNSRASSVSSSVDAVLTAWNGSKALEAMDDTSDSESSFRLLKSDNDAVWLECTTSLLETSTTSMLCLDRAAPISLQVQVGNGSWESSLIPPKSAPPSSSSSVETETVDFVEFKTLLIWREKV
jgi:hypothetical protein